MHTNSRKTLLLGLALTASLSFAGTALASDDHHGHAAAPTVSDAAVLKNAISGNDRFKAKHPKKSFEAYQKTQVPNLTVVSCSDSRVHTDLFGIDPHNNIFVIRDIGNQIKTAAGSVDYGVRHLPTRILLILGHSGCGAVKAAMGDYSGETAGIKAELDTLKPVIAADDKNGDFDQRWSKNVERNVDYQVKQAMEQYGDKVKVGQLTIVGGVYDFNDFYGKGRGTLVVTNIGGETDPAKIAAHPAMKELSKAQAANHVGSLAPAL